jgi:hypothetical protein
MGPKNKKEHSSSTQEFGANTPCDINKYSELMLHSSWYSYVYVVVSSFSVFL